jgi:hypothetical protein
MKTHSKLQKSQISSFMKFRLVVLALLYAYGRMDLRSQQYMYVSSPQDRMRLKL